MGPYAGVDYNLTLRLLQSRLQHIYHWQSYVRVDFIPQSGTDFGFCLLALSRIRVAYHNLRQHLLLEN